MGSSKSYIGNYGIVKIIKGRYKGRFGYYDDDDMDYDGIVKSVVYFGEMFDNAKYYYIKQEYITNDYTMLDLRTRKIEIEHKLWSKITEHKRLELIEEKMLIDWEIHQRLEDFIDTNKIANKKVFLSHSSNDKSIVVSVALDLKERGIETWLDAFDILPGESIVSKINQGLNDCEFVLLFLSKNSVKSNWVTKEWETIFWDEVNSNKIKIIPIKLEDCEIPKILKTKKYIDFSKDYNDGLYNLVNTIKKYEEIKNMK